MSPIGENFSADLETFDGTVLDISDSSYDFFKRHPDYTRKLIGVTAALEVLLIYIGFSFFNWKEFLLSDNAELVFLFLILPFAIPGYIYWRVSKRMQQLFFTQLAKILNMTYVPKAERNTIAGYFFNVGRGGVPTNVLSGIYKNVSIRLFEYEFTTGSGKHKQTHKYVVSEIDTKGPLPHLFLKPESSFVFGKPSGTKLLSLEGHFNDTFDVYVPEDSEINALRILEPDVMLKFIEEFPHFGFECFGTKTSVFQRGSFSDNRETLMSQLKFAERLYDELVPELEGVARG
jgi:hypothetical protein